MQTVMARGRSIPVEMRRRAFNPRREAEALFKKPVNSNAPHTLEDVSKESIEAAVANLLPPEPPVTPITPAEETPHQKVFRLVGERKFEEAARLAAKLINVGDIEPFFVYSDAATRRARDWFDGSVVSARRSISTSVQNITPEHAQVLLQNNPRNRRVKPASLANLMRDIFGGDWEVNGETIIVLRNGNVGDGQHRCWASLLTGTPFKTAMTFGVLDAALATIDIGEKRTAADRLVMRGQPDAVVVAATAATLFEVENGRAGSPAEVDKYVANNAAEIHAGIGARGSTNIKGVGPSASAAAATILLGMGAPTVKIKEFFKAVRTAEMTKSGNAARTLHLALFPTSTGQKPLRLKRAAMVALLVNHYAWWARGKVVREPLLGHAMPEAL